MSNYTRGPWRIGFDDGSGQTYITTVATERTPFGDLPYTVVNGNADDWGIEQGVLKPDDARLIVKAPDMLEMLIKLHAPMAHINQTVLEGAARRGSSIPATGRYSSATALALRALILEAGGEL
jgi:hypothetical protein